jgi:alpha,alpha-trehalase
MESGADNDIALISTEENSIISPDLNAFLYLEYECFSKISRELGFTKDSEDFIDKCSRLKGNINKYLWCDEEDTFYCYDSVQKKFVRVVTYTCAVPLYAGIVDDTKAKRFIERYMLNEDKLWSCYGLRTLTKDNKKYNNENIIKPYSNWQGPVWPIANYIYCLGLARYEYKVEALDIAHRVINLCINDIETSGGMHENYSSETGEPLAAPNFISWNLLMMNVCDEIRDLNR